GGEPLTGCRSACNRNGSDEQVWRLEVSMRQTAVMQVADQCGYLLDQATQLGLPFRPGPRAQIADVGRQIAGSVDFFREQVAFVEQTTMTPMPDAKRPGRRQTAQAQAVAQDVGPQCWRWSHQRRPRISPACHGEALVDDAARPVRSRQIELDDSR